MRDTQTFENSVSVIPLRMPHRNMVKTISNLNAPLMQLILENLDNNIDQGCLSLHSRIIQAIFTWGGTENECIQMNGTIPTSDY